jgi:ribosomal protein L28
MAKTCPICNKGSMMGGGYSHKTRATQYNPTGKRRRQPNLQWASLVGGGRIKVCTTCIKKGSHLKIKS